MKSFHWEVCEYICSALGNVAYLFGQFTEDFCSFFYVQFVEGECVIGVCDSWLNDHIEYMLFFCWRLEMPLM